MRHLSGRWLFRVVLLAAIAFGSAVVWGQSASPQLGVVAEFALGDACPVTGVLSPDGGTVWALMVDCVGDYTAFLQAFSVADGRQVGQSAPFVMDMSGNELFGADRPLVMPGATTLTADFVDWTTGATASFTVDAVSGAVTPLEDSPRMLTADAVLAALPDFTGYTDYFTYSDDRSLALTQDDALFYVFDVASGTELMRLAPPGGVEYAGAWFGPGNRRLYVSEMADPGNYDNPAETLHVFDIPGGTEVAQYESPYTVYAVSPDERLAVVSTIPCCDHMSLAVLDLATGALSDSLPTQTTTVQLNICKNDGRTTDFGWTSNDPLLLDILWLPDSRGFVTLNSEEFSSGPNPCLTNDSRLRVYAVTGP